MQTQNVEKISTKEKEISGETELAKNIEGLLTVSEPEIEVKVLSGLIDSMHNVEVRLSEQQADTKSPLFSVHSFEELGLAEELLKGIYAMKFSRPSKVQETALPLLLKNPPQNMIAQSQSGTGKTAAFVLTMLSRVDIDKPGPQAICIAPARELARQIMDVVNQMGQFTKCTTAYALKDSSPGSNITKHIIVGTPGTLLDLEKRHSLDFRNVKILVLDEADVMLDKQGMGTQSIRVKKLCPPSTQILLFSATFKPEVRDFANRMVPNPNIITLKREELSLDGIRQFYMSCGSAENRLKILGAIYGLLTIGQSIIFVQTRKTADQVQAFMKAEGHTTSMLHAGLESDERDTVIDEFRKGITKVLITTNVLARGIDILQVSLVINYDIPLDADSQPDPETYLHRIGRTGRFGRTGSSINFVYDKKSHEQMKTIEKFFGRAIMEVPADDLEKLEKALKVLAK